MLWDVTLCTHDTTNTSHIPSTPADSERKRISDATRELEELGLEGEEGFEHTPDSHHVYTGESLLEVILADHAYKYHSDNIPLSGAHVRGEHKVAMALTGSNALFCCFSPSPPHIHVHIH